MTDPPTRSVPPHSRPLSIKAPHGERWFEVRWYDDSLNRIPNFVLRGYCPCAGCQGHGGPVEYQAGHNDELREIEPVGNYAVRLVWGDGHGAGLYSFPYLRKLGELYDLHGEALIQVHPTLPLASHGQA